MMFLELSLAIFVSQASYTMCTEPGDLLGDSGDNLETDTVLLDEDDFGENVSPTWTEEGTKEMGLQRSHT